jgi:opacity protein-like surface antigen
MAVESYVRVAAVLLGAGLCVPAVAGAVDVEVSPLLGYRFGGQFHEETTDRDVDLKESEAFGLAVDVEYSPDKMVEVFYSRQSTSIEDSDFDIDVEYFQIGGVAEFTQDTYTPYAVGTIGATRFSPDGGFDSETRFSLTMGGGVKWYFNEHWAARVEGRAYFTVFDSDAEVFCVSSGGATCLFRVSGSVVWQVEALAGVTFRF